MVYGNFIFDGQDSRDYGLIVCAIGGDDEEDLNMALDYEVINFENNGRFYDYGAKHKDVLTFNFDVITHDQHPISRREQREIMRWLDNCEELKWLSFYDKEEEMDIWYLCRFTAKNKVKIGGNIIGFRFTVTCDSQYGYSEEKEVVLDRITSKDDNYIYSFNNFISTDKIINPVVIATISESDDYIFDISSKELTNNENYLIHTKFHKDVDNINVKNIIIDCENQCIFFDDGSLPSFIPTKNYYFPKTWLKFNNGYNSFKIKTNTTISNLTIKYREIYAVGEF